MSPSPYSALLDVHLLPTARMADRDFLLNLSF